MLYLNPKELAEAAEKKRPTNLAQSAGAPKMSDAAVISLAEITDAIGFHLPSKMAKGGGAMRSGLGKALMQLNPAAGFMSTAADVQPLADAARQSVLMSGRRASPTGMEYGAPDPTIMAPKNAMGPKTAMTSALAFGGPVGNAAASLASNLIPEPEGYDFIRRSEVNHVIGDVVRQGMEFEAGLGAVKAVVPGLAKMAMTLRMTPGAEQAAGQAAQEASRVGSLLAKMEGAKFFHGKVISEAAAGGFTGILEGIGNEFLDHEGPVNPGVAIGKTLLSGIEWGAFGAVAGGAAEAASVVNRQMIKKALATPGFMEGARGDIAKLREEQALKTIQKVLGTKKVYRVGQAEAAAVKGQIPDMITEHNASIPLDVGHEKELLGMAKDKGPLFIHPENRKALQLNSGLDPAQLFDGMKKMLQRDPRGGRVVIPKDINAEDAGSFRKAFGMLSKEQRISLAKNMTPDDAVRLGFTEAKTVERYGVKDIEYVPKVPVSDPEVLAAWTAKPASKLAPAERKALMDSIGGKGADLTDDELIKKTQMQRTKEVRSEISKQTTDPEMDKIMSVRKIRAARREREELLQRGVGTKDGPALIKGYGGQARLYDMSKAMREMGDKTASVDRLVAMGPNDFKELMQNPKIKNAMFKEMQRRAGIEKGLRTALPKVSTEQAAAVSGVLAKHGVTPGEARVLINEYLPPATEALGTGATKAPGMRSQDVFALDPAALDAHLGGEETQTALQRLREAKATMASSTAQSGPRPDMPIDPDEAAVKFYEESRKPAKGYVEGQTEEIMAKTKAGGKRHSSLYGDDAEEIRADAMEEPGYSQWSSTVDSDSKTVLKLDSGEAEVDAGLHYTVRYQDENGEIITTNLSGKNLIEEVESGAIKPLEVHNIDDEGLFGNQSGFLNMDPKALREGLKSRMKELGYTIDDKVLSKMPEEKLQHALIFTSLPSHLMRRYKELGGTVDAVLNMVDKQEAIQYDKEMILNYNRDALLLQSQRPDLLQDLSKLLREFDKKKVVDQAERSTRVAALLEKAGPLSETLHKVIKQVDDIRTYAQGKAEEWIKTTTQYATRVPEDQAIIQEWVDKVVKGNPNWVPLIRRGNYRVMTHNAEGALVSHVPFETLEEAQKAFRVGGKTRLVDLQNGKLHVGNKITPLDMTTRKAVEQESIFDLTFDAVEAGVPIADQAFTALKTALNAKQLTELSQRFKPRNYAEGFRDDFIKDILHGYRGFVDDIAKGLPAAELKNQKEQLMATLGAASAIQRPAVQRQLAQWASRYIDAAVNPKTDPLLASGIRQALYGLQLNFNPHFIIQNGIMQTFQTSLPEAMKYGQTGLGAFRRAQLSLKRFGSAIHKDRIALAREIEKMNIVPEAKKALGSLNRAGALASTLSREFLEKSVAEYEKKIGPIGNMGRALIDLAAASERGNRMHDALMYTDIGYQLGYRGDELTTFARNGINRTQFGVNDAFQPLAFTEGAGAVKDIYKTATMYLKFKAEYYTYLLDTIADGFKPTSKLVGAETKGLTRAQKSKLRIQAGKGRGATPLAIGMLAASGGLDGLKLLTIGSAAVAGGHAASALALEGMMRSQAGIPTPQAFLKKVKGGTSTRNPIASPIDDKLESMGFDDESLTSTAIHYGVPGVLGFSLSNEAMVSMYGKNGNLGRPAFVNHITNWGQAIKEMQRGNLEPLFQVASAASRAADNVIQNQKAERLTYLYNGERVAVPGQAGDLTLYNQMITGLGFEPIGVARDRKRNDQSAEFFKKKEQTYNYLVDSGVNHIRSQKVTSNDGTLEKLIDFADQFNMAMMKRGFLDQRYQINMETLADKFSDEQYRVMTGQDKPMSSETSKDIKEQLGQQVPDRTVLSERIRTGN